MDRYWIFLKNEEEREQLQEWFDRLHSDKGRGDRARLRRCESVNEVLMQTGFHRLCRRLPRIESFAVEGLALVAALLAWCEHSTDEGLAELLGRKKESSDSPLFSELRFQRLLAADDTDDFFHAMRRALVQAGKKSNPLVLADDILHWFDQQKHPDRYTGKRQWQFSQARPYFEQVFKYSN